MIPDIKPALLLAAAMVLPASASPRTGWETFLLGRNGCSLYGCCATDDGGMAAAGRIADLEPDLSMLYLVRIGPQGEVRWERRVGWEASCFAWDVIQTGAGFTVCGELATREGDVDGFVMRFDAFGRELWRRQLGGPGRQRLRDIIPAAGGGCYLIGDNAAGEDGSRLWLLRLDAEGETVWSREMGGGRSVTGWGGCMTPDSLIAVCGGSLDDMTLTLVDLDGNRRLHRFFDNAGGREYGRAIAASASGDLCMMGSSRSPDRYLLDVFLLSVDDGGDELWRQLLGGEGNDCAGSLAYLGDSLLLVYNTMSEGAGSYDAVLEIHSSSGERMEKVIMGGKGWDRVNDLEVGTDGRAFMVGCTGGRDSEMRYGWAVMMWVGADSAEVPEAEYPKGGIAR
ncbi:MAG: hypothetical protein R6U36_08610 [Candidatus Fermentibacteraceae bacterium]